MKRLLVVLSLAVMLAAPAAEGAVSPSGQDYLNADRLYQNRKYQEAIELYRRALASPPSGVRTGDIQRRIGDSFFKLGDFRSAVVAYRAALVDPGLAEKAQVQYFLGFSCFLVGRDADAVAELLKVPALYPEEKAWASTSYYWAGRASERMGNKDQAAEYYRKAGGSGTSTQSKFAQKKAEAVKTR